MTDERLWTLAGQAAELIPEAPSAHDSFGYLAWEELVLSTARRLQRVAAASPSARTAEAVQPQTLLLDAGCARLDASALLALVGLLAGRDDATCERALSDAVALSRGDRAPSPTCHRVARQRWAHRPRRTPLRRSLALAYRG